MKKIVVPVVLIFLLQLIVGWISLYLTLTDSQSGEWFEFSKWWPVGLIAFLFLPIVLGKWLAKVLNQPITWIRCIAIYFVGIGLVTLLVAIL